MDYSRKGDELLKKLYELQEERSLGLLTEDEYQQMSCEIQIQIDNLSILEDTLAEEADMEIKKLQWQKEGLEKVKERIKNHEKNKNNYNLELLMRKADF